MKKFRNVYWTIFAFMLILPVNVVFAQGTFESPSPQNELQNPLQFNTISGFLDAMLGAVVTIAGPIVVLMLVYSGFLFVSAQGNPEKLAIAKKAIMWTIIGAAVVLGAFVLSSAIEGTINQLQGNKGTYGSLEETISTLEKRGIVDFKGRVQEPKSVFDE